MDKNFRLLLVVTRLVSACGTKEPVQPKNTSRELNPYVEQFYSDIDLGKAKNTYRYNLSFIRLVTNFSHDVINWMIKENKENLIGICYTNSEGIKYVQIKLEYWNSMTEGSKWNIVYHELVHCVLGRSGHDSTGLMASSMTLDMTMEDFNSNWSNYNR